MKTISEIFVDAKALGHDERAQLIVQLWDITDPKSWSTPSEESIIEAKRRVADYEAGRETADSWSVVRERARRAANLDD
jgi:putative addiction module component (TIGR02574 family)